MAKPNDEERFEELLSRDSDGYVDGLLKDPAMAALARARIERGKREVEARRPELMAIVARLRAIGYDVDSIAPLASYAPYPDAVPILIESLAATTDDAITADILRVLGATDLTESELAVISTYLLDSGKHDVAGTAALALANASTREIPHHLLAALATRASGAFLTPLVKRAGELRLAEAESHLNEILNEERDEPDLRRETSKALRSIRQQQR